MPSWPAREEAFRGREVAVAPTSPTVPGEGLALNRHHQAAPLPTRLLLRTVLGQELSGGNLHTATEHAGSCREGD